MPITKLEQIFDVLNSKQRKRLVAAWAVDAHTIVAVSEAVKMGIIEGILVGDEALIKQVASEHGIDPAIFSIVHVASDIEAATVAVDLINQGKGDFLMKGLLSTDRYMRAILNKERGLMDPGAVLSHVTVLEPPTYHKLLIVGDVAIIPAPDLAQKVSITNYLIKTAKLLGIDKPKVGVLAPSEQVLPKVPSSVEASILSKMNHRGQIKDAIVEGPLGMDLIIDKESAQIKGMKSEVCGDADCILFPNIETGNVFYKTMTKFCGAHLGAIVMGARVPAVLSSRGDSEQVKLYSIALAALLA